MHSVSIRLSQLIERVTKAHSHIWSWRTGACFRCGKQTHWTEINYETRLHRGQCKRELDNDYFAALAKKP